jgi:hypothetical protein
MWSWKYNREELMVSRRQITANKRCAFGTIFVSFPSLGGDALRQSGYLYSIISELKQEV